MRESLFLALVPGKIGRERFRVRLGRRVRLGELLIQNVGQGVAEVEARRNNCDTTCSAMGVVHLVDAPCARSDSFR